MGEPRDWIYPSFLPFFRHLLDLHHTSYHPLYYQGSSTFYPALPVLYRIDSCLLFILNPSCILCIHLCIFNLFSSLFLFSQPKIEFVFLLFFKKALPHLACFFFIAAWVLVLLQTG
ncbi:hypothetical protein BJ508DRAFT_173473 [Ascobolus immersus RN42]|uniref:Uncharacterized protein n=1 Tax=Ascobolus immersus RN42 TaxID=1160509 RepID=A0A3N4HZ60_ASCIM|nr:hypothetical protein BJ508DRAFT_173473 [Ascobolus immersus RN42]